MPKPVRSLKLTPGKAKQLMTALDDIEAHVGNVADIWAQVPRGQRDRLLAASPALARFLALAERMR